MFYSLCKSNLTVFARLLVLGKYENAVTAGVRCPCRVGSCIAQGSFSRLGSQIVARKMNVGAIGQMSYPPILQGLNREHPRLRGVLCSR
jgi:hypothetical protein